MKAIIILSLLVLSCLASHHLRRHHHSEITPAQLAKILKGLGGHSGSSGSGSGSGSNEEFDFEGDQLAAKKLTVEQILKLIQEAIAAGKDVTGLLKMLKQHGGSSSGSGSGSGSNEEFDFEAEQLAAKKQSKESKIEKDIQEALLAGKDVTGLLQLLKQIKSLGGKSGSSSGSSSGSGSGSNEEFDFEGDQFAAKKLTVEQILKLIQEAIAAGKDVTGLLKMLKQHGGSSSGSSSGSGSGSNEEFDLEGDQLAKKKTINVGEALLKAIEAQARKNSGSGSNEEFDFEADEFAAKKHLTLQEVTALIAKYEAEGKDITKLMQIFNARSSGNNQEFDFEADQLVAKKQSKEAKIEKDIQEALLAGKDVTGLLQLLKQIKSLGGNSGSNSGSGSNEEFDFEADQFSKKQAHTVISVIH